MNPERWQRIERVFFGALETDPEQRSQYVIDACGADTELRADVEGLLRSAGDDPVLQIEKRFEKASLSKHTGPAVNQTVGRYRLKELLGQGGMGQVYRAERADGEFRQEVAVKLVSGPVFGPDTIRRFKAERQILARLNHANIARLIDGGTTEEGRPFLVMQLVDGLPITLYCKQNNLDLESRLELFQTTCEAVQYAHQALVIHRDLKPSNILVTTSGEVRLLDFGIAKLLEPDEEFTLAQTHTGSQVLTPDTAAPEQVRGEPVTTATDVYGLGVLLYRLLVGQNPYGLQQPTRREIEQAIVEHDAVPPSQQTTDPVLRKTLKGELDNIVLTALRKEPERRYGSARELSDDIRRFLNDEPVLASRDTFGYRALKFVRRHRLGVAAAATVATLILGFGAVTAVQARAIASERDAAQTERDRAEQVVQVLVDLFRTSDPTVDASADTTRVGVFLEQSQQKILDELADQPEMQIRMKHVLGQVYLGRNQTTEADRILQDALDQKRDLATGADQIEAAIALDLAEVKGLLEGRSAEPFLREVLELQRDVYGEQHPAVAEAATTLSRVVQNPEVRLDLLEEALSISQSSLPSGHPTIASHLDAIGTHHYILGDFEQAAEYFDQSHAMLLELHPRNHPDVLSVANNMAMALLWSGEHERALEIHETVLTGRVEVLGEKAPDVASSHNNQATIYTFMHDYANAEESFKRAFAIFTEILGPTQGHTDRNVGLYANGARNIGVIVQYQGRFEEALQWMDTAVTAQASFGGINDEAAATMRVNRANILLDMGQAEAAADSIELVLPHLLGEANTPSFSVAVARNWLGRAYWMLGRGADAEEQFRAALEYRENVLGAENGMTSESRAGLGLALVQQGETEQGTELIRSALPAYREFGLVHPRFLEELEDAINE